MSINAKQAYKIATNELGEDFVIHGCTELEDSWIFGWAWKDGTNVLLPPIQVKKDGSCDLWDKKFADAIEGSDWLSEHGKNIPISELEKMSE